MFCTCQGLLLSPSVGRWRLWLMHTGGEGRRGISRSQPIIRRNFQSPRAFLFRPESARRSRGLRISRSPPAPGSCGGCAPAPTTHARIYLFHRAARPLGSRLIASASLEQVLGLGARHATNQRNIKIDAVFMVCNLRLSILFCISHFLFYQQTSPPSLIHTVQDRRIPRA